MTQDELRTIFEERRQHLGLSMAKTAKRAGMNEASYRLFAKGHDANRLSAWEVLYVARALGANGFTWKTLEEMADES